MLNGALNIKQSLPICMSNGFRNNTCYRPLTTVTILTIIIHICIYVYIYMLYRLLPITTGRASPLRLPDHDRGKLEGSTDKYMCIDYARTNIHIYICTWIYTLCKNIYIFLYTRGSWPRGSWPRPGSYFLYLLMMKTYKGLFRASLSPFWVPGKSVQELLAPREQTWGQESLAQTFVFTTHSYNLKCNNAS